MNLAKKPEAAEEAVSADNEEAVCCFCGQSLWLADSVSLLIQRRIGDEEILNVLAER